MSSFFIPFFPDFFAFLSDSFLSRLYLVRRFFLSASADLCFGMYLSISSRYFILSSSVDAS